MLKPKRIITNGNFIPSIFLIHSIIRKDFYQDSRKKIQEKIKKICLKKGNAVEVDQFIRIGNIGTES